MANDRAVGTIRIRATGNKELRQITRQLDRVRRTTRSIAGGLTGLRRVFFATFGALGIREVARAADSVQLLSDRIRVFTGNAAEAERALNLLFDAANLTNTSIDSIAETYNRVALATQELGLNTNQLIGFTATLQNTFRLSGASIAEAGAAAIQLSQGLASGQLRGQELRSVLEQNAVIGSILSKELNTTRGNLIKFAESGRITSEVVLNALAKNAREVNERAQELGQTFGQTLTKAFNRFKQNLNEVNRDFELNEKFAVAVERIVGSIEDLAVVISSSGAFQQAASFLADYIEVYSTLAQEVLKYESGLERLDKQILKNVEGQQTLLAEQRKLEAAFESGAQTTTRLGGGRLGGGEIDIAERLERIGQALNKLQGEEKNLLAIRKNLAGFSQEVEKVEKKTNAAKDALTEFETSTFSIKLQNGTLTLQDLNKALAQGTITFREYNKQFDEFQIRDLAKRFNEGQISAIEYRNQLIAIEELNDGFEEKVFSSIQFAAANYGDSIGTLTSQLQQSFERTFNQLEDTIFNSLKKGKFLFQDFAQFVLDELTRVAIRTQIVAPFAAGFGNLISSQSSFGNSLDASRFSNLGSSTVAAAKGAVFESGRQRAFASGGIIDSPTFFPLSNGMGLAGEAGSEAVVPLTRTSDGDLGVKANPANVIVNVNNNSGVEVEVESNQVGNNNVLDITITKAVNRALQSGQLDRTLNSNFGLYRKGTR